MAGVTRRTLLVAGAGAVGAAVAVPGIAGCAKSAAPDGDGTAPAEPVLLANWPAPAEQRSSGGVLHVDLTAQDQSWTLDGQQIPMMSFGAGIPSPNWRIRPGDTVMVRLRNELPEQPTNLHPHGLHVSPVAPADDVFLSIRPGAEYIYEYQLPEDHPPGYYWYHPHRHEFTTEQVSSGMFGGIIVDGLEEQVPALRSIPQAVVNFQGQWFDNGSVQTMAAGWVMSGTQTLLVNGQVRPVMQVASGQQVWLRMLNASSMSFARFGIAGHTLQVIAVDGNPLAHAIDAADWTFAPGSRIDAILTAGLPGSYVAGTLDAPSLSGDGDPPKPDGGRWYRRRINGITLNANPGFDLIVSEPASSASGAAFTGQLTDRYFDDLNAQTPDSSQRATMDIIGKGLGFNKRAFDADQIDFTATVGTMQEWTFINKTTVPHPIHIHVNPVQVISVNGVATGERFYRDTFLVPGYSQVVIRTRYKLFGGKTVLHCHNLDHEDSGMMATVMLEGGVMPSTTPILPSGVDRGHH